MSCPICGRPAERAWRPFCSRRCADVDLGRWMTGGYALPGERPEDVAEAERLAAEASEEPAEVGGHDDRARGTREDG